MQLKKQQAPKHGQTPSVSGSTGLTPSTSTNTISTTASSASSTLTSSTLAAALSLPYLNFTNHNIKPAKLALTPHHLYYLLSRFGDLGIDVGPMSVRLESLHAETQSNYVSFMGKSQRPKGGGSDHGSIHSVSSMRSVMSGMSSLWSSFGLSGASSAAKVARQQAANVEDLKYLYSAFTKIPCLRLTPDRRARLISGYEEFPFDTAVPLIAFKNMSALEISDIDIRQFYGWDRLAEQLRSLTVKRASIEDPGDLLIDIVLDDMNKRRRRSSKAQMSPVASWAPQNISPKRSPTIPHAELVHTNSAPGSPNSRIGSMENRESRGLHHNELARSASGELVHEAKTSSGRPRSNSPVRPTSSRTGSAHGHIRGGHKMKRSGSNSSHSSTSDTYYNPRGSSSNLLSAHVLPPTKWRFLKHLSLADNSLTSISAVGLVPLANTLNSLDLSANLFSQIPDSLATLTALRALNLSNCMIDSLHSLTRNPLPAISALNLRANRLISLAGIERLYPLERLDLRDNKLTDPTELARLTGIPELKEIWVAGNPFTKTHPNYRVTIFNLFRNTPGFTEDMIIDATGPGYNERRQLVDRVPERENVPVVRPPPMLPAVEVMKPVVIYGAAAEEARRPHASHTTSETYASSSRRKRTSKRRIVDLSTSEAALKSPQQKPLVSSQKGNVITPSGNEYSTTPDSKPTSRKGDMGPPPPPKPRRTSSEPEQVVPKLNMSATPKLYPTGTISEPEGPQEVDQDWSVSGEIYKKKIEALREEVGNGWLSVLSEEGWDAKKLQPRAGRDNEEFSPTSTIRPSTATTPRPGSQMSEAKISNGRTLGPASLGEKPTQN